jgi:hypothetical protein
MADLHGDDCNSATPYDALKSVAVDAVLTRIHGKSQAAEEFSALVHAARRAVGMIRSGAGTGSVVRTLLKRRIGE